MGFYVLRGNTVGNRAVSRKVRPDFIGADASLQRKDVPHLKVLKRPALPLLDGQGDARPTAHVLKREVYAIVGKLHGPACAAMRHCLQYVAPSHHGLILKGAVKCLKQLDGGGKEPLGAHAPFDRLNDLRKRKLPACLEEKRHLFAGQPLTVQFRQARYRFSEFLEVRVVQSNALLF